MITAAVDIARNIAGSPGLLFLAVAGVVIGVWACCVEYDNNREN